MSDRTKVFGLDLGIDPKVIVVALVIVAAVVYYFTSSPEPAGSGGSSQAASVTPTPRPALSPSQAARVAARRNGGARTDRDTLKLVPVDGSRGDVDPTLHLRLLERVKNVPPAAGLRNVFEAAGPVMAQNVPPVPSHPPILPPKTAGTFGPPVPPPPPPFNIPLKYYGFAKSKGRPMDGNRGLFLDGENILIGGEGDVLEKRFLIVALTPTSARLEDTQAKQGQDLQVTPEAPPSQ